MFKAFADAQQSAVPEVRNMRVRADRDGDAVEDGRSSAGTGYREYAVAVVRTIKNDRRGFERERQVVSSRRRDVAGMVEDRVERRDDASRGRGVSALILSFLCFLLRWGSSEGSIKFSTRRWAPEVSPKVVADASSLTDGREAAATLCVGIEFCH